MYVTKIVNLRPPNPKLSDVWDVGILFRCFDRLVINSLLANIAITETYCAVMTALDI